MRLDTLGAGLVGACDGELTTVLLDEHGPVIIDLPQAVDAAGNNHAFEMLERDVGNMSAYFGRFAPELRFTRYAKEMWALYQQGKLTPETELTGEFAEPEDAADIDAVMREIKATLAEQARREAMRGAEDGEPDEAARTAWLERARAVLVQDLSASLRG